MNYSIEAFAQAVLIGIGATAFMDVWLMFLKRINVPTLNFSLLGRWVGHVFKGQWFHNGIAKSSPIPQETAIGWLMHYAIGIAFALLLVAFVGDAWIKTPSLLPALALGVASVTAPLLIMQPAMGAGIASRRTATPLRNSIKSLLNHSVFGGGLYVAAMLMTIFH